ncbi:MAG: alpha/beta fold hydrolase [Acidimicrobiia bacterium]|nr:alpha/beta fold hydrolase [Acidimicrobiia bacterium]
MSGARNISIAALPLVAGVGIRYGRALREIEQHVIVPPDIPGVVSAIEVDAGTVTFRVIEGSEGPPLVLLHGWGRSGDSAWWPVLRSTGRTVVCLDLPGHGASSLDAPFTFDSAALAVAAVIEHLELDRPTVVGHSMGAAVALTLMRDSGADAFSGLVGIASSAYWVRPRLWVALAAAPYVLSRRSPVLINTKRTELRATPDEAGRIAWEYAARPSQKVLRESAAELRRFDARQWADLELPPTAWVVAAEDGIIHPRHQRASGALLGAEIIELDSEHSVVTEAPDQVLAGLEREWLGPAGVVDSGSLLDLG